LPLQTGWGAVPFPAYVGGLGAESARARALADDPRRGQRATTGDRKQRGSDADHEQHDLSLELERTSVEVSHADELLTHDLDDRPLAVLQPRDDSVDDALAAKTARAHLQRRIELA